VRLLPAATVCLLILSCREIQPFQPVTTIQGYRLDGIVTSANGIPLGDVQVILFYYYDYYSTTPLDTQKVIVQSTTRVVDVAIYTASHVFVRQLYFGYHAPGPLSPISWDGLDANGMNVPSGKYLMRFALDSVVIKYSTIIIDGNITATTDSTGKFSIGNGHLPVGAIFDSYFSNNTYDATYIVLPEVDLLIRKPPLQKAYTGVQLDSNQITSMALTLE
jgi:hypothetical protein